MSTSVSEMDQQCKTQQLLQDKVIVAKLGGSTLEQQDCFLQNVSFLRAEGAKVIVVHGGGASINTALAECGLASTKIDGQRVTDAESLQMVALVLATINLELVGQLSGYGLNAVGFVAPEQKFLGASKMMHTTANGELADLGWVGQVNAIDQEMLKETLDSGYIPVIAPLGMDDEDNVYNINADYAAAAIASFINADYLILVTDVPGVLADPGDANSALPFLKQKELHQLLQQSTISGGMLPKLKACAMAVDAGVKHVHISDGRTDWPLVAPIIEPGSNGTSIVP